MTASASSDGQIAYAGNGARPFEDAPSPRPHDRRTKVVSQSVDMLHASLKLGCALNGQAMFEAYQAIFLSIFN